MKPKPNFLSLSVLVLAMFTIPTALTAENKDPATANQKLSRITQQLVDNGFKKCSEDLDKVVRWVHADDTKYGMLSTWNQSAPNTRTASSTSSSKYEDGSTMITTF